MAAQERAATSDHATSTPTDHDLIEQRRARASAWCMALAGASLVALGGLGVASLDGIAVTVTANALSSTFTVAAMIAFIEHSTGGALGLLEQRRHRDYRAICQEQQALRRDVEAGLGGLAAQVQQLAAVVNRYVAPGSEGSQETPIRRELDEIRRQLAMVLDRLPGFGEGVVACMDLLGKDPDKLRAVGEADTVDIMPEKVVVLPQRSFSGRDGVGRAQVRQHNGSD